MSQQQRRQQMIDKQVIESVKEYKSKQAILNADERKVLAGLADDDMVVVVRRVTAFGTYSLSVRAADKAGN
jgi:ribosomal protein L18E